MNRPLLAQRDAVYGVDFSGARDAERKIWIARGVAQVGGLHIEDCAPISEWCGPKAGAEGAARALAELILQSPQAAFALDFPFGLPLPLLPDPLLPTHVKWPDFIREFASTYASPEAFRELCRAAAPRGEHRRATDAAARTPFCPYNLRIYRQTWFGIARVLAPLLERNAACAPPMQPLRADRPWLLEICPASTLKAMGMYRRFSGYKQPGAASRRSRQGILAAIGAVGGLTFAHGLKQRILANTGGDALDSVIAAFTAFKLLRAPRLPEIPAALRSAALREAWVYCWPGNNVEN